MIQIFNIIDIEETSYLRLSNRQEISIQSVYD